MKFRNLRNWSSPQDLEGLVFFAQLLEELLFDYSLDTYKPSAMNTSTLCREARQLIRDIESEVLDAANLKHVLKELVSNLNQDEVAQALIPPALKDLGSRLDNEALPLREKRVLLEILGSHIALDKYKSENERLLAQAVVDGNGKKRIRALARSYVTTLLSMGYSSEYLYPTSRQFFFMGKTKITSCEAILRFFDYFPGNNEQYKAIFRVSDIFSEIAESCSAFGMTISGNAPDELSAIVEERGFLLDQGETYLTIDSLHAMDVHAARTEAEKRVEMASTLMSMFHHKEVAKWRSPAILINLRTKKARLVKEPTNPMLKCADLRTSRAAEELNSFLDKFTLEERKSFDRFFRSAELHGLALRNDEAESQLLNLWVALETLTPSKAGGGQAKINVIKSALRPFLSISYIPRLVDCLRRDMFLWNPKESSRALRRVEGGSETEKVFLLLISPNHEEARQRLLERFGDFYLLRNRFYYLMTALATPKKAAAVLDAHWQRVEWQLRRIYRARNTIVHAGVTPSYIDVLIKNLHDYIDITTNTIIGLASDGDKVNTIDQAFEYVAMAAHSQLNELRKCTGRHWGDETAALFASHNQLGL